MLSKTCNVCHVEKGLEEFSDHRFNKDGKYNLCKSCHCDKVVTTGRLKMGFSMYKPDSCECCGKEDVKLDLDHCHDTGMFRGFICRSCNKSIGVRGDTYESLLECNADQMYLDYLRLANYRMGKIV